MNKTNEKVELVFGVPEYGWLPTEFWCGETYLYFDTSNAFDKLPTDLLCEALISVLNGQKAEVCFELEPAKYVFKFIPRGKEIDLLIYRTEEEFLTWKDGITGEILKREGEYQKLGDYGIIIEEDPRISGNYESIVLPLYKALNDFNELEYDKEKADWKDIDKETFEELTALINSRK